MSLISQIQEPVAKHLEDFNRYYSQLFEVPSRSLRVILRYALRERGKQIRPLLVYLSAAATGGVSNITPVAAAMVELVHNASLLHDDVVDQADLRRCSPTIFRLWKAKGAVLAGDYMLSQGLKLAVESGNYQLLAYLNQAVQLMSVGELEQLQRARRQMIDEEGYYAIIRGKTAALLAACTASGAFSAHASPETIEQFRIFGENLGIAFQIKDDILDFSFSMTLGKRRGNDLREGKITLPVIHALRVLPSSQFREYLRLVRRAQFDRSSLQKAIDFVRESPGIDYANAQVEKFTLLAKRAIASLPASPYIESLYQLADYLVKRTV